MGPAAIAGYCAVYWWGAGFFTLGAVLSAVLFRRRVRSATTPAPAPASDLEPIDAIRF